MRKTDLHRQAKFFLSQLHYAGQFRAAASEDRSGGQLPVPADPFELLVDHAKNFFQARLDDYRELVARNPPLLRLADFCEIYFFVLPDRGG